MPLVPLAIRSDYRVLHVVHGILLEIRVIERLNASAVNPSW